MTKRNNSIISGYITNLGKYNEGELIGEWVTFPISDEELEEVLERIGVSSEPDENGYYYEEYFFSNWDCDIDGMAANFGEFPNISTVNETAEKIEEYGDLAYSIIEAFGINDFIETDPDDYMLWCCDHSYDLGYTVAEESGILYNLPEIAKQYFDFEAYGRNFELETLGAWCSDGFIEYVG